MVQKLEKSCHLVVIQNFSSEMSLLNFYLPLNDRGHFELKKVLQNMSILTSKRANFIIFRPHIL